MDVRDAYKSIYESLTHAAASEDCGIDLKLVDAESLEDDIDDQLKDVAGVLIPGGFGVRGIEGKINAARYAREHKIPYLGLCLGMQAATIEFARNVCGVKNANSTEFDKDTPDPVISLLEEQRGVRNKGASMRLGTWPTKIITGHTGRKNLRRHRGHGAAPAPLRVQHEISRPNERKRLRDFRNITGWHSRRIDRAARSPVFCWLPVSSRIPKQTEQTAPALQRIHSGVPGATDWACDARSSRSRIAAPSPQSRNSFRNDKIETERIELAQIAKQICRGLAQILFLAESANGSKFQVSGGLSPPLGDLEIALP